ncbi:MAG TPA: hypothetical protein VMV18_00670 [bacterium]|nr:hypothetical protein [bacterium]
MNAPTMRLSTLLAEAKELRRGIGPVLSSTLAGLRCARDAWYRVDGQTTPPQAFPLLAKAYDQVIEHLGHHSDLNVLTHRSIEIPIGFLEVEGVADAVFFDSEGTALVSRLHVLPDEQWKAGKAGALEEHRAEANLLAWGFEARRWSVCYIHANTGEIVEHSDATDAFTARRDLGLIEEVAYWMGAGVPPPRPFEDFEKDDGTIKLAVEHEPCRSCPSRAVCWPANA